MKIHYKKYLIDWLEHRLDPKKKAQLENHLDHCGDCREYFMKMEKLFAGHAWDPLPNLEPAPFELTKIKNLAREDRRESLLPPPRYRAVNFLYAAVLVLAIVAGFWMGKGMAEPAPGELYTTAIQSREILQASGSGFANIWETISGEANHED
ncbi:MAG: zf-HC2 domain-containing protein [Calditrichia bacterium]